MKEDLQLGYLVIGASDPAGLDVTMTEVFGLISHPAGPGRRYRMDEWATRLLVLPTEQDGLLGLGLVAATPEAFTTATDRLTRHDVALRQGTAEECQQRGVRRFVSFQDPAGTPVELAETAALATDSGYDNALVPGGFVTGSQGLGHVVLVAEDRDKSVQFYVDVLGFRISDTVEEETPEGVLQATFMHCNRRHHSVAIGQRQPAGKSRKHIGHVMLQARSMDAVGMAYDRALDAGMSIFRTLGRHPNDQMFSFYARTQHGFDIEFGAGAVEITDDWQVGHYDRVSAWGHRRGQGFGATATL